MNAINALDNQNNVNPVDLSGLSPEEIRGVSGSRINREQMMGQAIDRLMGFQRMKSTMATQEEARKSSEVARSVSEEKLRQLKAGDEDMEISGPDGKPYQIKRRNLTESLKYVDQAKLRARQGKLADEQLKVLEERIPMKIKDASGEEKTYPVSAAQYPAIAKAIEDDKKSKLRAEALEKFKGKKIEDLSDMDLADIVTLGGKGVLPALANRVALAGETMGLSDAHYRHYAKMYADYSTHALKMGAPAPLVETINGMGRKLGHNHLLLNIPSPTLWGVAGKWPIEATKTVTVQLPTGMTADMVYKLAEADGLKVSDILQDYYDKSQE